MQMAPHSCQKLSENGIDHDCRPALPFVRTCRQSRFKQASACQPPTREICCIGPGIVDSVEQDLYMMFKYRYILKAWIFSSCAMLTQRSNNTAWLAVSPEIGPQFPEHGAGNRAPISGKTPPPEIGAQFGPLAGGIEPATFRLQACAPPTRPNSGGQHGHTSSFATWPSPPVPARPKPKSKLQTGRLDFGVWILDFGVWSLDFGFWILDFGFWILDFGFWISDFGFWILDFGFWISDFGFWISDFGFWISLVFVLFVAAPNGPVWILDFGFWILG